MPFDYTALADEVATLARDSAVDIRKRLGQAAKDIIEAGQVLLRVKAALPYGVFRQWIHAEFGWSARTATGWMSAAESLGGRTEIISVLSPTALLALATAPECAVREIEARVREGARPTVHEVQRTVSSARETSRSTAAGPPGGAALNPGRKLAGELTETVRRHGQADVVALVNGLRDLTAALNSVCDKLAHRKPATSMLASCGRTAEALLDELYRLTGARPGSGRNQERRLRGNWREIEGILRRLVGHARASRETTHKPTINAITKIHAALAQLLAD
jgi:hypothetical protein